MSADQHARNLITGEFILSVIWPTEMYVISVLLGVWGETLWSFANGLDDAPVRKSGEESIVKSVGNSTTTVRDLVNDTMLS